MQMQNQIKAKVAYDILQFKINNFFFFLASRHIIIKS